MIEQHQTPGKGRQHVPVSSNPVFGLKSDTCGGEIFKRTPDKHNPNSGPKFPKLGFTVNKTSNIFLLWLDYALLL